MKKTLFLMVFGFGLLAGTSAYAQQEAPQADPKIRTQQVIESIPSLHGIALEISTFEAKTAGKSGEYKNAAADLRALKMKYAAELELQIAANKGNAEVTEVLTAELKRTKEEIAQLN